MLPRIEFSPARQRLSNALRSSLSLQVESSLRFDSSGRFCHILVEATCKGRLGNLNRVELDLVEGRLKVKGLVEVIGPQTHPVVYYHVRVFGTERTVRTELTIR